MWHFKFFGTPLAALTLLGFVASQPALAAYPLPSDFSVNPSQKLQEMEGSFQLAVMGTSGSPLDIPTEKFPKKATKSEKPAVKKPKATPKKAAKPKKKKIKTASTKKASAKKPAVVEKEEGFLTKTLNTLIGGGEDKKNPASQSLVEKSSAKNPEPAKKEEGLLTKTLNTLVGSDKDKKEPAPKPKSQKMASKKPEPEKKEEGLLTKTLKSLVGGEEEKKETKKVKKKSLNPISMVPTGSVSHKTKKKEESKTAKSETKKTIKDSFQKLIGVGAVDKEKIEKKPEVTKKAEVKKVVKKAPPKPKRITAKTYIEQEEAQLEKDRGGVKKGKNVLKESFKTLLNEKKETKKALTE